jgi:hypothetical protein
MVPARSQVFCLLPMRKSFAFESIIGQLPVERSMAGKSGSKRKPTLEHAEHMNISTYSEHFQVKATDIRTPQMIISTHR